MLEATGENLDWFWNEWMYPAGYPEFTVTASYDAARARSRSSSTQTQRDSLKADSTGMRYSIPEAFPMPVTIRVGTGGRRGRRSAGADRDSASTRSSSTA